MRILMICAVLSSLANAAEITAPLESPSARRPAPNFALLDAAGKTIRLSSFSGKTLLLDLWATNCGGCVKEIPAFIELSHVYANKGLAVVGISMDILYADLKGPAEAWSLVRAFVKNRNVDYPILMGDGGFTKRYAVTALPATYLIDKRGRVAATYVGVVDREDIEANIKKLLAER